jgi:flagellar protein FlaI
MVADSQLLAEIATDRGWSNEELAADFDRRQRVLQYLLDNDITDYDPVSKAFKRYVRAPDRLLDAIEAGTLTREDLTDEGATPSEIEPSDLNVADLVEEL